MISFCVIILDMKNNIFYKSGMSRHIGTALLILWLLPGLCLGQDQDTTRQDLDFEQEQRDLNLQQFDRSMSGGMMTEMGTYQIPSENQYYQPPFMGQKHLDRAVEAYRKEIENRVGEGWYWQFLKAVSPFIRLELGAFQTLEMEYPDRDNPLWQSYSNDEEIE